MCLHIPLQKALLLLGENSAALVTWKYVLRTVFDEEKNTQPCSKNIDDSMKGRTGFPHEENSMLPHQFQLSDCFNSDKTYKHVTETQGMYMNSHQLLDILRNCDLNWFGFVEVIQDMLRLRNIYTYEAFQQLLLDFGGQLSFLGLSIEDERIVEQSRQAYLLSEREQINLSKPGHWRRNCLRV